MGLFGIFGSKDTSDNIKNVGANVDTDDPNIVYVDVGKLRDNISKMYPDINEGELNNIIENIKNEIKDYYEDVSEKSEFTFEDTPFALTHSISNYMVKPQEDRLSICSEIDMLIGNYPEALQSVRIYASTITYGSPEFKLDEYKWVLNKLNKDVTDEMLEGAKKFLYRYEKECGIKRLIYMVSRDLVKYGDAFLEIIRKDDKIVSFAYIPSNSVYIEIDSFGNPKRYYQIKKTSLSNYKDLIKKGKIKENEIIVFEKSEILHFNDGSFIGASDSSFKSLIPIWRAYCLLEQSLVIHRVTRSRRYVVFFVDVSGKDRKEVKKSIRAFVSKLRSFFTFDVNSGIKYNYKSSIKTGEDLVIPVTKNSATKMQIIPADTGAHKIDDLNFFHKRLLNILFTEHLFGDKKNAKNPDIDKAFNRIIRVYQRQLSWILEDVYTKILNENGYDNIEVSILFPTPDSEEETKLVDTLVRRLLLINQLTSVLGQTLPFTWVINYVFQDLTMAQLEELKELLLKQQEEPSEDREYVENLVTYNPTTNEGNINLNTASESGSGGSIIDKLTSGEVAGNMQNVFEKIVTIGGVQDISKQGNVSIDPKQLNDVISSAIEYLKLNESRYNRSE